MRLTTVVATALVTVVPIGSAQASAVGPFAPPTGELSWGECEDGVSDEYQCATLAVPLNHDEPGEGSIDLALIRHPANPARREGAVLLNPGGPGGSGFDFVSAAGSLLEVVMGLNGRFDIVGFDPRGVDRSGGISCVDDEFVDAMLYTDDTPDDAAAAIVLLGQQVAFAQACVDRYGDTLRHYSTEATARDMDVIRDALGDELISYIGVSYGTYLGAVYATLFPERVRAMVLDSAFDPTGDSEYDLWVTQLVGFEDAFRNWAAWCEEDIDCLFTDVDVAARWDRLLADLEAHPVKSDRGRPVNHVVMETATVASMYNDLAWPALAAALADAERGDGTALLRLADSYNGRSADGTFQSIRQSGPVILCASGIGRATPSDPDDLLTRLGDDAPRFSRGVGLLHFYDVCADLIPDGVELFEPAYAGSAPVLVVGGLNDPATPIRWAEELATRMGPAAELITFEGEGHGQILSSTCVTDAQATVIVDLQLPPAGTSCAPDPDVPRPAFWDDIAVPAGVGELVDDPAIALQLGLPPSQMYADVRALTGDVADVADAYTAAFEELGFVTFPGGDVLEGTTTIVALAIDGTTVFVLLIPPDALVSNRDLEGAAELAPEGQGFAVIAALSDDL